MILITFLVLTTCLLQSALLVWLIANRKLPEVKQPGKYSVWVEAKLDLNYEPV